MQANEFKVECILQHTLNNIFDPRPYILYIYNAEQYVSVVGSINKLTINNIA